MIIVNFDGKIDKDTYFKFGKNFPFFFEQNLEKI